MDISTTYLGMKLKSPLVCSAAQPLTDEIGKIRKLEDAGASAVVLYSLFEEQLSQERLELHSHLTAHTDSFSEALSFFPEPDEYIVGPEEYLNHIRKAKEAVHIPIIASLNGCSLGGWTSFAKDMAQAGADAIELNIYSIPTDPNVSGETIEKAYTDIVKAVKSSVKIPVALKLSPFFTNMGHMARQLDQAGIDALVLFNRFYQPDIDLEELEIHPDVILSTSHSLRLPLRWVAMLYGRMKAELAATRGIHRAEDSIKMIMAGAAVTMLCSVLLRYGINHLSVIEKKMRDWMEEHEYDSVKQMRGSMSQLHCENPSAFERAQYIRVLHSFRPNQ